MGITFRRKLTVRNPSNGDNVYGGFFNQTSLPQLQVPLGRAGAIKLSLQ